MQGSGDTGVHVFSQVPTEPKEQEGRLREGVFKERNLGRAEGRGRRPGGRRE